MSLISQLKKNVSDKIYKRGKRYYNQGRILDYKIDYTQDNQYKITARVWGTNRYSVKISVEVIGNSLYFDNNCTCPYDWGNVCKHEVAVLYRFLKDDYNNLSNEGKFNTLVDLSRQVEESKPVSLSYRIKGLMIESMVNFKLTLLTESMSTERLEKIVSHIHDPELYFLDGENLKQGLHRSDVLNIDYLSGIETRKSRSDASLLFSKNEANFNFLLNLIQKNEVFLAENEVKAETGSSIYPDLYIKGNINQVELGYKNNNYTIYHAKEDFDKTAWTVIEDKVHPVKLEKIERLPDIIDIPEDKRGEFLFELLPNLEGNLNLDVDERLEKYELITYEPEINLKLDYQKGDIYCYTEINIEDHTFSGVDILSLDLDDSHYKEIEAETKIWSSWNISAMEKLISYLEQYNFHVTPQCFVIRDENDIQNFITDGFIHIPEEWNVTTTEEFEGVEIKEIELDPIIEFKDNPEDKDTINWFEFQVMYNIGGRTFSRKRIKNLMRHNRQGNAYIKLDNNYYIIEEGEKEKKVNNALDLAEDAGDGEYRSAYHNLLYYHNLLKDSGINFSGNKVYNELQQDITDQKLVKEVEIPGKVKGILRDYQKRGYYWFRFLHKYNFGGILADDMGLGKTIQTLTFLKSIEKNNPVLVVCPRTLIYNWGEEINKFFPDTNYLIYHGTPEEREGMREGFAKNEIIITSYSIISRDYADLNDYSFSYCILDEAQRIKNHKTKRAKGVKRINAGGKLALTGTPLENSVDELWSIFDFLMKGYLGNYNHFRRNYLNPIKKNNNQGKLVDLKQRVAPFILRRKKEEVLKELPQKIINIHKVDMTRLQEDTYRTVLEDLKGNLMETVEEQGFNKSRINVLSVLTKLRQVCNHPGLILNEADNSMSSAKIESLQELVEEGINGGHKLIIFSQFVQMLKLIRKRFEEENITYMYLDGSTRDRMKRVKKFNEDPDVDAFLISLKAGGTGLNLTAADIVVHVDPWWNPMVERQASDRAHRIGQENRVMVYKLITRGTVEEKMLKLQKRKQNIFESVIEDNANPLKSITWEDIKELLSYDN